MLNKELKMKGKTMKKLNYLVLSTIVLNSASTFAYRRPIPTSSSKLVKLYKKKNAALARVKLKQEQAQKRQVTGKTSSAQAAFEKYFNRAGRTSRDELNQQLQDALQGPKLPAQKENALEKILNKYRHQVDSAYSNMNFKEQEYRQLIQDMNPDDEVSLEDNGVVVVESTDDTTPPAARDLSFVAPFSNTETGFSTDGISGALQPEMRASITGFLMTNLRTGLIGSTLAHANILQEFQIPAGTRAVKVTANVSVGSFLNRVLGSGYSKAGSYLNLQIFNGDQINCEENYTISELNNLFPIIFEVSGGQVNVELTTYCQVISATNALVSVGVMGKTIAGGFSGASSETRATVRSIDIELLN